MKKNKTYSQLRSLPTFLERYRYLKLSGAVGYETFGVDRYLNQNFYRSQAWLSVRDEVIVRDMGCDLGVEGYDIHSRLVVHHMNPVTLEDLMSGDPDVLNPEYLITTTHNTHMAIHYGDETLLPQPHVERRPNDTIPWKT